MKQMKIKIIKSLKGLVLYCLTILYFFEWNAYIRRLALSDSRMYTIEEFWRVLEGDYPTTPKEFIDLNYPGPYTTEDRIKWLDDFFAIQKSY